jgi:hypothetical protein
MTVCVAAIADGGDSLVLVADRQIGVNYVETGGIESKKILPLCGNWWVMFSAEDTSSVFPVLDAARLTTDPSMTATQIGDAVYRAFVEERDKRAERACLIPRAYTISTFQKDGLKQLGAELFREIGQQFADVTLGLYLLVCGFPAHGKASILRIADDGVARCDMPGFAAIGSGQFGTTFMMYFRDLSPTMLLREVLYYAVEAKYFGEQASGVGPDTDMYILRADVDKIELTPDQLDKQVFDPLCLRLSPRNLNTETNIRSLNKIALGNTVDLVALDKKTKKLMSLKKSNNIGN